MTEEQARRIEAELAALGRTAGEIVASIERLSKDVQSLRGVDSGRNDTGPVTLPEPRVRESIPGARSRRLLGEPEFARIPLHAWISRAPDWILIGLFLAFIFLPFGAYLAHWQSGQPVGENRTLAARPAFRKDPVKTLPAEIDAYYKDHFGFRKQLIQWQTIIRFKWLGLSNDRIVVGKNGWVFLVRDGQDDLLQDLLGIAPFTPEELASWKQYLEDRQAALSRRGIRYLFVIAPDKWSIYPEMLPTYLHDRSRPPRMDQLLQYLRAAKSPVEILDLRDCLLGAKKDGRLYFQQDTHWNGRGYFVAYREICRRLQKWFPEIEPQALGKDYEIKPMDWAGGDWGEVGLTGENLKYQSEFAYAKGTQTSRQIPVDMPPGIIPQLPEWYAPIEKVQPQAIHRLLFLHDSFMRSAFADHNEMPFAQHFAESLYVGMVDLPLPPLLALVDYKHPDVVVEERVQRHLKGLAPVAVDTSCFGPLQHVVGAGVKVLPSATGAVVRLVRDGVEVNATSNRPTLMLPRSAKPVRRVTVRIRSDRETALEFLEIADGPTRAADFPQRRPLHPGENEISMELKHRDAHSVQLAGTDVGRYLIEDVSFEGPCPRNLTNSGQFVSMSGVPDSVAAGQAFTATAVFRNTGTTTWQSLAVAPTNPYRLGSATDDPLWGLGRVDLPLPQIPPGGTATFTFSAIAPKKAGTYSFSWRMVEETVEWFGDTGSKTVVVH